MRKRQLRGLIILGALLLYGPAMLVAQATTEIKIYMMEFESGSDVGNMEVLKVLAPPGPVGLGFFAKATGMPPHFPYPLVDTLRRNDIVMEHSPEQRDQDFNRTWTKSRTYDDQGRLVAYSYSGCEKCTAKPYKYTVHYGKAGRIDRLDNSLDPAETYTVQHDGSGQMLSVHYWEGKKLIRSASLLAPEDIEGGF